MLEPSSVASPREIAVQRWERFSTIPLAVLALVYLALYAYEVLAHPIAILRNELIDITDIIWALFIIDFVTRFGMHDNKKLFLRRNVIELIGLLLPMFRAFRMFRVVIAIGFLSRVTQSLQARIGIYLGLILPLLIFTCALGVYDAEHNAVGANITQFGDAVWWAIVTVATVGYGDYHPVTFEGRAIAVLLMFSGVAMLSVVTVSFASWFLGTLDFQVTRRKRK
ncbi:MAG: potassium channel family protein [Micrococcales bacterium]